MDLQLSSEYISGINYEFSIMMGMSDYIVDWGSSKVTKEWVLEEFDKLKPLTSWASKSTFQTRDDALGSLSCKRITIAEHPDATHFIWTDSDIIFGVEHLFYIENAINGITTNTNCTEYIISPEIVRIWDSTWDCLVADKYITEDIGYHLIHDPFKDSGIVGDISLVRVINNINGQPITKFGAGMFNCISKPLLDRIPIPESMGHYGSGDDTFIMHSIDKLNKIHGDKIFQFKLKNLVMCENWTVSENEILKENIKMIDRRDEFKKQVKSNFQREYSNLN